jgi:hypothetical protein
MRLRDNIIRHAQRLKAIKVERKWLIDPRDDAVKDRKVGQPRKSHNVK